MTAGDPERQPASIAGVFRSALVLYARRFGLYAALASAAFVAQYLIGVALQPAVAALFNRTGTQALRGDALITGVQVIVDAFIVATVSIGVALDAGQKPADWRAIATAASERWGVVAVVGFATFLVIFLTGSSVFGPPEATFYGLLTAPIIMFWGALTIGQTVAAIEPAASRLVLPFVALGKGLAVAFRIVNLGRLAVLSVLLVLPLLLATVLDAQFRMHHVRDAAFWAFVPIDAVVVGPMQAIATMFYLDFVRRAGR